SGGPNLGTDALLDFLATYAPHPGEAPPARGAASADPPPGAAPLERKPSDAAPLSLFVVKLKDTLTGDTLGDKAAPIFYPAARAPEAAIHFALEAKSRGDEDKVSIALHKMLEEDRALHFA